MRSATCVSSRRPHHAPAAHDGNVPRSSAAHDRNRPRRSWSNRAAAAHDRNCTVRLRCGCSARSAAPWHGATQVGYRVRLRYSCTGQSVGYSVGTEHHVARRRSLSHGRYGIGKCVSQTALIAVLGVPVGRARSTEARGSSWSCIRSARSLIHAGAPWDSDCVRFWGSPGAPWDPDRV